MSRYLHLFLVLRFTQFLTKAVFGIRICLDSHHQTKGLSSYRYMQPKVKTLNLIANFVMRNISIGFNCVKVKNYAQPDQGVIYVLDYINCTTLILLISLSFFLHHPRLKGPIKKAKKSLADNSFLSVLAPTYLGFFLTSNTF